jgi:hypothetical protein
MWRSKTFLPDGTSLQRSLQASVLHSRYHRANGSIGSDRYLSSRGFSRVLCLLSVGENAGDIRGRRSTGTAVAFRSKELGPVISSDGNRTFRVGNRFGARLMVVTEQINAMRAWERIR